MMDFQDSRLPVLYEQRRVLSEQISAIEEAEIVPVTAGLLGKCYRYRNNYSLPETEADYWWLYSKVTAVEGRDLTVLQFERANDGSSTVQPNATRYWNMDGHEEITAAQFAKQWGEFLGAVAADYPA